MKLNVTLADGAPLPKHAKKGDAGLDLTTRKDVLLLPGDSETVGTGVSVEIPEGFAGLVFPRSGLASKKGVTLKNAVGVVDSGYRGEIMAPLLNVSDALQLVERGERICQLVIVPVETVECVCVAALGSSERGETGFGSSGRF